MKPATAAYIVMNDRSFAEQVLAHNEHGQTTCGWTPPN
ncbi:hypothetical protein X566_15415 [Afipia sp. P52-10]|nr:hypothetical protein X566_15415 [Afipia sp. P52-10]